RSALDKVLAQLPALAAPTISTLADEGWVALNTVIQEHLVRELLPRLKESGASGIVEYPLSKIVDEMLRALATALPDWARVAWEALALRVANGTERPVVVQAVVRGPRGVVLCERRELRGWELPGGAVRPGEPDEEALRREV